MFIKIGTITVFGKGKKRRRVHDLVIMRRGLYVCPQREDGMFCEGFKHFKRRGISEFNYEYKIEWRFKYLSKCLDKYLKI